MLGDGSRFPGEDGLESAGLTGDGMWGEGEASRVTAQGFPGGSVGKNPPANAGDMGLIPDPEKCHLLQSHEAHVPQLLSLRSGARDPQLLSSRAATTEAREPRWSQGGHLEKPTHRN